MILGLVTLFAIPPLAFVLMDLPITWDQVL
jgi:hypothetical protein